MNDDTHYVTYHHLEPAWWILIPVALGLLILVGLVLWFLFGRR
jgi:hypothetical protein